MAVKELFQWGELFKFPVRPLQDGFIGIIQPVALTFGYGIQSLCIELAVVDGDICIDGAGDLNADETAAAAGVGQQVLLVAGAAASPGWCCRRVCAGWQPVSAADASGSPAG